MNTNFNGKHYEYVIHSGTKTPRIDLLLESETEERNGTEIKIYMKNTSDIHSFSRACSSELIYFDNVYLDNYLDSTYNNKYVILEYNTFKYRPDSHYSSQLHLIIGKVPYPINWDELGIPSINIPCGLQFQIGDLQVTPERESIRYIDVQIEGSDEYTSTKDIILKKIEDFKNEILELYKKQQIAEFEDYEEYKTYNNRKGAFITFGDPLGDHYQLDIGDLTEPTKAIFGPLKQYQGHIPDNLFTHYKIVKEYNIHIRSKSKDRNATLVHKDLIQNLCITIPRGIEIPIRRLAYLFDYAHDLTGNSDFLIVERETHKLSSLLRYYKIGLDGYNYSETNALRQFKLIRDYITSEFNRLSFRYEDLVPTSEWLQKQKDIRDARTKAIRKENSFVVYNYGKYTISEGKEYVIEQELVDFKGFIIYGFDEDEEIIKNFRLLLGASIYSSFPKQKDDPRIDPAKCRLYKIARRSEKYFVNLNNAVHVYDFMGNNEIFKRFATAALIHDESKAIRLKGYSIHNAPFTMDFRSAMEVIFPPVAVTLRDVEDACNDFGRTAYTRLDNKLSDKFFNEMVEIAKQYGLYDKEMYEAHKKLERYVEGLELINYVVITETSLLLLVDFLLLKGKKIASLWTGLEPWERELLCETIHKSMYMKDVFDRDRGFLGKGEVMYNSYTNYVKLHSKTHITNNTAHRLCSNANKTINLFTSILAYNESRQAAVN